MPTPVSELPASVQTFHTERVGRFDPNAHAGAELELALPSQWAGWESAGRVAQFVDSWLKLSLQSRDLALADLSYAVNELMENAVKYCTAGSIELSATCTEAALVLTLRHCATPAHAARYLAHAHELMERDPFELLAESVERNALNPEHSGSGLGLLSLLSDYGAALGFEFVEREDQQPVAVTTQAHLPWLH